MAAVVFDPEAFRAAHPGFADENRFTDQALQACFDLAAEIVGNEDGDAVPYDPEAVPPVRTRAVLLDLVTCHIATQNLLWDDAQAGPLASAAQGSVNASFQTSQDPTSPAWWQSTKCGAQAWVILSRYASGPLWFGVRNIWTGG